MRPMPLLYLGFLLLPAWAGAQEQQDASAPPAASPAPVSAAVAAQSDGSKPRAATKSRSFLGQVMVEMTQALDASSSQGAAPASPPAAQPAATRPATPPPSSRPRDTQVAAKDPVD